MTTVQLIGKYKNNLQLSKRKSLSIMYCVPVSNDYKLKFARDWSRDLNKHCGKITCIVNQMAVIKFILTNQL